MAHVDRLKWMAQQMLSVLPPDMEIVWVTAMKRTKSEDMDWLTVFFDNEKRVEVPDLPFSREVIGVAYMPLSMVEEQR